jgi:hypothetical protein
MANKTPPALNTHGEGKRTGFVTHGLKQQRANPVRVRGQQKQPVSQGSNGVEVQGAYAEATLTKPGTHAPSLFDGNTKMPKQMIPTSALPDAPNPGNMGVGGADIPGGGTFQNKNYPVNSHNAHNFKGGNKSPHAPGEYAAGGGNAGPVQEMRNIADRAKRLVYGGPKGFTKTVGEADDAGPNTAFKGEVSGGLRAKAEDMPYRLNKSYEKKGAHGTSVEFKPLGLGKISRPLVAA